MWKNISAGECIGACVPLAGECVNNCSVFELKKDCVDKHCMWVEDGSVCRSININVCDGIDSESGCEADTSCFWLKRNGSVPVEQCVDKVYANNCFKVTTTPLVINFVHILVHIYMMFTN
jgi:hypothetical protein